MKKVDVIKFLGYNLIIYNIKNNIKNIVEYLYK